MGRFNKLIGAFGNMSSILEGIKNRIFTNEDVEEIAKIRWNICEKCHNFDTIGTSCTIPGTAPCCKDCGCILNLKVRALSAKCPIDKWSAFMDEDAEKQLKDSLD